MLELWERAYKSEFGIEIGVDNRRLLRQHLYQVRTETDKYDNMVIVIPEQDNLIWLVHKDASGFGANHQGNVKPLHF